MVKCTVLFFFFPLTTKWKYSCKYGVRVICQNNSVRLQSSQKCLFAISSALWPILSFFSYFVLDLALLQIKDCSDGTWYACDDLRQHWRERQIHGPFSLSRAVGNVAVWLENLWKNFPMFFDAFLTFSRWIRWVFVSCWASTVQILHKSWEINWKDKAFLELQIAA